MIIKLILLVALLFAASFAYRGRPSALSLFTRRMSLCLLLAAAAVAITFPPLVTDLANIVGVGRGTDLVLYGFVVGSIFVWIGLYRRLHDLEHKLVVINRAIALQRGPAIQQPRQEAAAAQVDLHVGNVGPSS
jgi:hypothetical protein